MKIYSIPDELDECISESVVYEELRDRYVKVPWGYKKALFCARKANKLKQKFWQKVYELYPEVEGKTLSYQIYSKKLYEKLD